MFGRVKDINLSGYRPLERVESRYATVVLVFLLLFALVLLFLLGYTIYEGKYIKAFLFALITIGGYLGFFINRYYEYPQIRMEKEQIILDCKNLHPKRAYPISYVADIYVETLSLRLFAFRRIVFQVNSTTQFTIPNTIYKNYRDMERFVIENYL